MTGYGRDDCGLEQHGLYSDQAMDGMIVVWIRRRDERSPKHPDRLLGPPGLLCNGYSGSLPGGKVSGL